MQQNIAGLATSLAAFFYDLGARRSSVTVVTISEFGRRVAENGSRGFDHGWGNMMLVAGAGVKGGQYYGSWTRLRRPALATATSRSPPTTATCSARSCRGGSPIARSARCSRASATTRSVSWSEMSGLPGARSRGRRVTVAHATHRSRGGSSHWRCCPRPHVRARHLRDLDGTVDRAGRRRDVPDAEGHPRRRRPRHPVGRQADHPRSAADHRAQHQAPVPLDAGSPQATGAASRRRRSGPAARPA